MEQNCIIISIYPFPKGLAPTNRILAYSKGLVNSAMDVTVAIPFPTDSFNSNSQLQSEGSFDGIRYVYTSGIYKSKYKIGRVVAGVFQLRRLKGLITSTIYILNRSKKQKIDNIIVSTDEIFLLFYYSIICKFFDIRSVFIFDEFPTPIRHKLRSKIPAWKIILYKFVLKRYTAFVSISEELSKFYNRIVRKPTFILPVIVDTDRFKNPDKLLGDQDEKYLCYMGNLELSKDNVDVIIKAFSIISKDFKELKLHIYGRANDVDLGILQKLIVELDLEGLVILKGLVDSYKVPGILSNAQVLVSSQPKTVRAMGGFPTKLGEYLVCGVPALLTDVGENAKYVIDQKHVFFATPENPEKYAEKLREILSNYSRSKDIALEGKRYVMENFSHEVQGQKLAVFLKSIPN